MRSEFTFITFRKRENIKMGILEINPSLYILSLYPRHLCRRVYIICPSICPFICTFVLNAIKKTKLLIKVSLKVNFSVTPDQEVLTFRVWLPWSVGTCIMTSDHRDLAPEWVLRSKQDTFKSMRIGLVQASPVVYTSVSTHQKSFIFQP